MGVNGKDKADVFDEYFGEEKIKKGENTPIMCDGVDVSKCPFYIQDGSCSSGDTECTKCKHNFCFYKDMKLLEKENEELKYEIDRQKETIIYLENYDMCHKTLIQYKQALKEIRDIAKYSIKHNANLNSNFIIILQKIDEVLDD